VQVQWKEIDIYYFFTDHLGFYCSYIYFISSKYALFCNKKSKKFFKFFCSSLLSEAVDWCRFLSHFMFQIKSYQTKNIRMVYCRLWSLISIALLDYSTIVQFINGSVRITRAMRDRGKYEIQNGRKMIKTIKEIK
jgi:hypothetical protein